MFKKLKVEKIGLKLIIPKIHGWYLYDWSHWIDYL